MIIELYQPAITTTPILGNAHYDYRAISARYYHHTHTWQLQPAPAYVAIVANMA